MNQLSINGHELPRSFVDLINTDRWKKPNDATLADVLGIQNPEAISFFSVEQMTSVTADMVKLSESEDGAMYNLSSSDGETRSTFLVPVAAVYIAGGYEEESICLDYRLDSGSPRVMCQANTDMSWREVAPNVDAFFEKLGLA